VELDTGDQGEANLKPRDPAREKTEGNSKQTTRRVKRAPVRGERGKGKRNKLQDQAHSPGGGGGRRRRSQKMHGEGEGWKENWGVSGSMTEGKRRSHKAGKGGGKLHIRKRGEGKKPGEDAT